jgi:chromobox protein 1/chromobox protein 3
MNIRKDGDLKTLDFYVSWKARKNNKIPNPSWVTDHLLKLHNPEVLCDYLLKKIKWPKPAE